MEIYLVQISLTRSHPYEVHAEWDTYAYFSKAQDAEDLAALIKKATRLDARVTPRELDPIGRLIHLREGKLLFNVTKYESGVIDVFLAVNWYNAPDYVNDHIVWSINVPASDEEEAKVVAQEYFKDRA